MRSYKRMRRAVTMIELIFVIIILGIVSSIGAEIIARTYESYIVQRAQYRANAKTEWVLNQVANRLRYAIPGTVGFRTATGASFQYITELNTGNDKVLQWVAYDGDSFEAMSSTSRRPGWSGFCDINASTASTIATPGSDLSVATNIISNLGGTLSNAILYFPDGSTYGIASGSGESISLDSAIPSGKRIFERYKLAWSSYALSVEGGDLYLYYNFAPIVGTPLGNNKSLLLKDVTNFRFKGSEGAIRLKVCKKEKIGSGTNDYVKACKEKVIF